MSPCSSFCLSSITFSVRSRIAVYLCNLWHLLPLVLGKFWCCSWSPKYYGHKNSETQQKHIGPRPSCRLNNIQSISHKRILLYSFLDLSKRDNFLCSSCYASCVWITLRFWKKCLFNTQFNFSLRLTLGKSRK